MKYKAYYKSKTVIVTAKNRTDAQRLAARELKAVRGFDVTVKLIETSDGQPVTIGGVTHP